MTHDIYIVKTRTNKHKQTDVLLYVNDGCGLNNCYSIKCNTQQETAKISTLAGVGQNLERKDRTGLDHGSDHRKKSFKDWEKNPNKSNRL